mgnify:CR=1 FL=1
MPDQTTITEQATVTDTVQPPAAEHAVTPEAQKAAEAKAKTEAEAKAKTEADARTAQAIATGVADGLSRSRTDQPDRALGRSKFTIKQLLEAKHAVNADGSPLTPGQQLEIDSEMETRHQEDLGAAVQMARQQTMGMANTSAQYPEMADQNSPLFRAVAESIGGDPTLLPPKALLIATKAAAHDLDIKPMSKRTQSTATQARAQVVQQIQSAQAAGALQKGAGGAGPSAIPGVRDYHSMTWKDLENEPMPQA